MSERQDYRAMAGATTRSRLIVALLVLIVLLVLGMAWQAQRSIDAHNETAIGVLHDYAGLTADEFARRAMGATGYYGYYTAINDLRELMAAPLTASAPAQYAFRLRLADRALEVAGRDEVSPELRGFIVDSLSRHAEKALPDAGFVIDHALFGGEQHTFVVSWDDAADVFFGFESDREWLSVTLQNVFDEDPLLPRSLAGGAVTNELLYLRMNDRTGRLIFETGTMISDAVLATRTLGDEYNGVFAGHTVSVSIEPVLAESLIIGGLPASRLPLLIAIVLLTTGLLLAAIRQLQRENAVMQLRGNFVAEVSHELRTPLTQIRMFTESLLFGRLPSDEDRTRALSIINRESQRLIHMVENILRFSDIQREQPELALQRQAIAPIIDSVVNEFQVLADATESTIETDIDDSLEAHVDANALRQVLLNLLDNAIKYGPRAQKVRASLQATPAATIVSVADEGPGVPENERQSIWRGYYRLDRERDSAIAGTGIGLAVVGELVEKHGGTVRVEDSEHGGALFIIELPR